MLPVAVRTGLEPATPGVTGRYSNQLNYRTNCSVFNPFFERDCKGRKIYDTSNNLLIIFLKKINFKGNQDFSENAILRLTRDFKGLVTCSQLVSYQYDKSTYTDVSIHNISE